MRIKEFVLLFLFGGILGIGGNYIYNMFSSKKRMIGIQFAAYPTYQDAYSIPNLKINIYENEKRLKKLAELTTDNKGIAYLELDSKYQGFSIFVKDKCYEEHYMLGQSEYVDISTINKSLDTIPIIKRAIRAKCKIAISNNISNTIWLVFNLIDDKPNHGPNISFKLKDNQANSITENNTLREGTYYVDIWDKSSKYYYYTLKKITVKPCETTKFSINQSDLDNTKYRGLMEDFDSEKYD